MCPFVAWFKMCLGVGKNETRTNRRNMLRIDSVNARTCSNTIVFQCSPKVISICWLSEGARIADVQQGDSTARLVLGQYSSSKHTPAIHGTC